MRAGGERETEDKMVGWYYGHNGYEFAQIPGDNGQGSLESCSPWGLKESNTS